MKDQSIKSDMQPHNGNSCENVIKPLRLHGVFRELHQSIQFALLDAGFQNPTPIQKQVLPAFLSGRDILGCAQTGTGKSAAFLLPIIQKLTLDNKKRRAHRPRALIVVPTRELALQLKVATEKFAHYLNLTSVAVYGGVKQKSQVSTLASGIDILIATPGRLLDLINQRQIYLDAVGVFILDEADRMLEMGFINDILKIAQHLPKQRQSAFFSATLSQKTSAFANILVNNPMRINLTPTNESLSTINQKLYYVSRDNKTNLLIDLLEDNKKTRVVVFVNTKNGVDRLLRHLHRENIEADGLHSDISQPIRFKILEKFKNGTLRILVATDVASRGIDIELVTHVINYNLPHEPQVFIHRIGRTARAGFSGEAISFCDADEKVFLQEIEKFVGHKIPIEISHSYHNDSAFNASCIKTKQSIPAQATAHNSRERARLLKEIPYSQGKTDGKGRKRVR